MIVVAGIVVVAPDSWDRACKAARAMAAATRAEAGCKTYGFYADIDHSNRLRIYEEWESPEALTAHFNTPHMATFRKCLGELEILSRDVYQFEGGVSTPL